MTYSAMDELRQLDSLLSAAEAEGAENYAGGRLMITGLRQRRARVLTEHLEAYFDPAGELLDLGLTRAPTRGTGGEIGVLAGILAPLQDSLASLAQGIIGRTTARGQIPGTIQESVALRVAAALPGSLNLRLVPAVPESQEPLFDADADGDGRSLLDLSLERLIAIVSQTTESREVLLGLIADAGPRAASHLHALTKVLVDNQVSIDMHWRSPRGSLHGGLSTRVAGVLREVLEDVSDETRERVMTGRIVGANLVRSTFDLQIAEPDGTVITGKVHDDALEDLELFFGEQCTATVEVRESSLRSGETKETYTLLRLDG